MIKSGKSLIPSQIPNEVFQKAQMRKPGSVFTTQQLTVKCNRCKEPMAEVVTVPGEGDMYLEPEDFVAALFDHMTDCEHIRGFATD